MKYVFFLPYIICLHDFLLDVGEAIKVFRSISTLQHPNKNQGLEILLLLPFCHFHMDY